MDSNLSKKTKSNSHSTTSISSKPVENLPSQTHSGKFKLLFKKNIEWRCMKASDIQTIRKYKPKMLSYLRITGTDSEKIGANGVRSLCKALSDAKRISSLNLDERTSNLKHLTKLLHSTSHLKEVFFNLNLYKSINFENSIKNLTRLGRNRHLSDFHATFSNVNDDYLDIALHPRKREKIVRCLSQQLKGLSNLKNLTLNACFLVPQFPTTIKSLRLNITNAPYNLEELQKLASNIQRCDLLESLGFVFDQYNSAPDFHGNPIDLPEARVWASLFEKTQKLKSLSFTKCLNAQQQPEAIQTFLEGLKHLKQLTTFELHFCKIYTSEPLPLTTVLLDSLSVHLPTLAQLSDFRLNLHEFSDFKTTDFQRLTSTLQHLKSLKDLHLTFPKIVSPDECLVLLAQTIQSLTELESTSLDFSVQHIAQKSLATLTQSIPSKKLISLRLNMGSHRYDHVEKEVKGFKKITQSVASFWSGKKGVSFLSNFSQFSLLAYLSLHISTLEISTQEFKDFSLGLQELKQVQCLDLHLPEFGTSNDFRGLRKVMSSIQTLPKLTMLYLNFSGTKLCDQQMKYIASTLAECKSLEKINLRFNGIKNLSEKSLGFLKIGLRELLALEQLWLDFGFSFRSEKKFKEKALSELIEGLTVLKNLENLSVSCPCEPGDSLSNALKGFQNFKNLTYLSVNGFGDI